jgi:hypothetical protein
MTNNVRAKIEAMEAWIRGAAGVLDRCQNKEQLILMIMAKHNEFQPNRAWRQMTLFHQAESKSSTGEPPSSFHAGNLPIYLASA